MGHLRSHMGVERVGLVIIFQRYAGVKPLLGEKDYIKQSLRTKDLLIGEKIIDTIRREYKAILSHIDKVPKCIRC